MAYGPHAVGHLDGKVVFVRGAAPDEEVDAEVREERRTFSSADLVAVVRPSPQRRTPPCPYLPRCGGCPWQHLTYAAQLAAKRDIVREQLRRLAGVEVDVEPVLPSPNEFGYRRRIKLRVSDGAVGFYAAASHELVPIEHCLLAEPPIDAAIGWANELVRALRAPIRRIELIGGDAHGGRLVIAGEIEGPWDGARARGDEAVCQRWLTAHPMVCGLALRGRGWRQSWGDVAVAMTATQDTPPDAPLPTVRAPGFTQVNPGANAILVDTVCRLAEPGPGMRMVDLFAGAGNLSLPLRRHGAAVVAVEQDRGAAADAAANAERETGPMYRVICGRAEKVLHELGEDTERFDLALLDPPRSGALGCVRPLLRLAPRRIIYVSCDPATLGRDVRILRERYRVDVVQPIDMFPHTYHVETVVRLTLSCDSETPGVSSARRRESAKPQGRRRARRRTS
jgi:23S rRNA (uracil1939-C5)-methyltransferase